MTGIRLTLLAAGSLILSSCHCGQTNSSENSQSNCLSAEANRSIAQSVSTPTGPTVTARGNSLQLFAPLPKVGEVAPNVRLTNKSLGDVDLTSFKGKTIVLNIFPSIDTKTCSMSVRQFNELAAEIPNVVILCVSMDLPFALDRFCAAEGIDHVETLSAFRSDFGTVYGVKIASGGMAGLFARSVVVIDPDFKVAYTQLVDEMTNEPNYDQVLTQLKGMESENSN